MHGLMARGKGLLKFVEHLRLYLRPSDSSELVKQKPGLHLEEETRLSYGLRLDYIKEAILSGQDVLEAGSFTSKFTSPSSSGE